MDTNVLVAGLRSRLGASYALLQQLRTGQWTLVLSNTVAGEYHEILHREAGSLFLSHVEIDHFLDGICALAEQRLLATEWEPAAMDPDDEPLVQLAREAKVLYIVTHNVRHFAGTERFGWRVFRPGEFLKFVRQQK